MTGLYVDNIEANVQVSKEATVDANEQLYLAAQSQKKARKRACCCFSLLILLAIFILVLLFGI